MIHILTIVRIVFFLGFFRIPFYSFKLCTRWRLPSQFHCSQMSNKLTYLLKYSVIITEILDTSCYHWWLSFEFKSRLQSHISSIHILLLLYSSTNNRCRALYLCARIEIRDITIHYCYKWTNVCGNYDKINDQWFIY